MTTSPGQSLPLVPHKSILWSIAFVAILFCLGLLLWWSVSAIDYQPTFRPAGQILFECSTHIMETSLCAVNPDGSDYKIFKLPYYAFISPSWSPDGTSIAFLRDIGRMPDSSGRFDLSVIKADGSGMTELTDQSGSAEDPAWSPDGKTLAFAKFDDSGKAEGIYTIQPDGSNLTQVSNFGAGPVWSPDGKRIAFTNVQDGIYLSNIETGQQIKIASGISAKSLAWSPSGLQIAFIIYTYTDPGTIVTGLGLMNIDGSNLKEFQGKFSSPAWSPDGTRIAYNCGLALCVMNPDGSGKTRLSQNGLIFLVLGSSDIPSFSWSPDGQYIVYWFHEFCPTCPPGAQLWIMKADGSQQTKLTDGDYDRNPVWRPVP